jgi:hypothetical protein
MATEIETNALEKWRQRVDAARQPPATLFEVAHRRGIWEVTKDGRFYGHYHSQQSAFDAVQGQRAAVAGCGDEAARPVRN